MGNFTGIYETIGITIIMCFVYWLFDEQCVSPETDGYVGVSSNMTRRLRRHRTERDRVFSSIILFDGTEADCYALEKKLRPHPDIGWNLLAGGMAGAAFGHSAKTLQKISEKVRTAYRDTNLRERRRNSGKGRRHEEETKHKISASHIGIRPNAKTLEKMSLSIRSFWASSRGKEIIAARKPPSEETRQKISASHKGLKPSQETRLKLSLATKKRMLSIDARMKLARAITGTKNSAETCLKKSVAAKAAHARRRAQDYEQQGVLL